MFKVKHLIYLIICGALFSGFLLGPPPSALKPSDLSGVFPDISGCDQKFWKYDNATETNVCAESQGYGTDSITALMLKEVEHAHQRAANCGALACEQVGEQCTDSDDEVPYECTVIGGAGAATWVAVGCVTDYTDLIVDGDTTPGGLSTVDPTSIDFVWGDGLTGAVTGTATAPIITVNSDSHFYCKQLTALSVTATTNEETLFTCTIAAGNMGTNGVLEVTTIWSFVSADTSNKIMRIRLGGISGTAFRVVTNAVAADRSYLMTSIIANRNSASAQISHNDTTENPYTSPGAVVMTGTVNTATNQDLVVTGQKVTAGDTLTLEAAYVKLLK